MDCFKYAIFQVKPLSAKACLFKIKIDVPLASNLSKTTLFLHP